MKVIDVKNVLSPAIAGLMMCAGVAVASAQDVIIAPEQDIVIREYVKKKPLASISVPGVELNIGSTLPETVEVHRFERFRTSTTNMSSLTTGPCLSSLAHARS